MMHELEYNLIRKSLNRNKTLLEWGSGTGTLYFSQYAKEIDSIEHNREWFNKIQSNISLNNILNINYHFIPWNSPRPEGGPTEYEMFETYINYVDKINKKFDVVLIDGRARFWCVQKILPYLKKDSIVFIHDFWAYEPHMLHPTELKKYNQIFNWYEEIESIKTTSQTIIKLKAKK